MTTCVILFITILTLHFKCLRYTVPEKTYFILGETYGKVVLRRLIILLYNILLCRYYDYCE